MIIRLESPPAEDLIKSVSEIPGIVSVRSGDDHTPRLIILLDGSIDDSEADLTILTKLKEKGVAYREIRRGESLEEKVVEITNKDKDSS